MLSFIISFAVSAILIYALFKWRNGQSIFQGFKLPNFGFKKKMGTFNTMTQDDKFTSARKSKQEELDRILDKISKKGIKSLSNEESKFLDKWQG